MKQEFIPESFMANEKRTKYLHFGVLCCIFAKSFINKREEYATQN